MVLCWTVFTSTFARYLSACPGPSDAARTIEPFVPLPGALPLVHWRSPNDRRNLLDGSASTALSRSPQPVDAILSSSTRAAAAKSPQRARRHPVGRRVRDVLPGGGPLLCLATAPAANLLIGSPRAARIAHELRVVLSWSPALAGFRKRRSRPLLSPAFPSRSGEAKDDDEFRLVSLRDLSMPRRRDLLHQLP